MEPQANIEAPSELDLIGAARASDDFRRVLVTGAHMQVVVMTIPPGGEIGAETHPDTDQALFFVDGDGEAILDNEAMAVSAGDLVFVRAGVHHNFVNTGDQPLRIATAYAPPEHEHGTVHPTRADADADEHH
jgi:mannose-6-phosphate isomerase-like protein (cupin superfamily)